jgi:hypothetical protein
MAEGFVNNLIAWSVRSWGIFSVLSSAAPQKDPFVDGGSLEGPVAECALDIRINFHLLFSLGGHSKDLAALFQVHEN